MVKYLWAFEWPLALLSFELKYFKSISVKDV